jgi:hypothetical protein
MEWFLLVGRRKGETRKRRRGVDHVANAERLNTLSFSAGCEHPCLIDRRAALRAEGE